MTDEAITKEDFERALDEAYRLGREPQPSPLNNDAPLTDEELAAITSAWMTGNEWFIDVPRLISDLRATRAELRIAEEELDRWKYA